MSGSLLPLMLLFAELQSLCAALSYHDDCSSSVVSIVMMKFDARQLVHSMTLFCCWLRRPPEPLRRAGPH